MPDILKQIPQWVWLALPVLAGLYYLYKQGKLNLPVPTKPDVSPKLDADPGEVNLDDDLRRVAHIWESRKVWFREELCRKLEQLKDEVSKL